jgi:hypothetical protein
VYSAQQTQAVPILSKASQTKFRVISGLLLLAGVCWYALLFCRGKRGTLSNPVLMRAIPPNAPKGFRVIRSCESRTVFCACRFAGLAVYASDVVTSIAALVTADNMQWRMLIWLFGTVLAMVAVSAAADSNDGSTQYLCVGDFSCYGHMH